ncbi:hypothetical protein [Bacillus sp. V2I10]|uniref:hypothetical protein n=1 Tax=Bacillus sp. V2I10 TaxID=3042276 RepID=UPI00278A1669|nr:hypothetical protein [Bacillus sp. V2I10]MDQ0860445.1 hypothetical protein [Bacillus sp. V2I10]
MMGMMNELYIVITLFTALWISVKLPKIFPPAITLLIFTFSAFIALTADHILDLPPYDIYDVNDSPEFEVWDFIYYSMYGFFGSFFLYLYQQWRIRGMITIVYIILWSMFSVFYEWVAVLVGIFDFSKGYKMEYSFPVYLFIQTFFIIFFHFVLKEYDKLKEKSSIV